MECQVSLSASIDDPLDNYELRQAVAEKDFKCCECGDMVLSGATYELATGDGEDGPFEAVTCLDCAHVAEAVCEEGRMHGTLWEDLGEDEAGFEVFTSACLLKIPTASAKAKMVERWRDWKGLA